MNSSLFTALLSIVFMSACTVPRVEPAPPGRKGALQTPSASSEPVWITGLASAQGIEPAPSEGTHMEKDEYGGIKFLQLDATGYFRLEKLRDRWIMVTPAGHPFYIMAINGVTPWYQDYRMASFETKYKKKMVMWARTAIERVDSLGFNAVAYKTADQVLNHMVRGKIRKKPFTVLIPFIAKDVIEVEDYPDVFADSFRDSADVLAKRYCEPVENEAYLLGYFLGNELDLALYDDGKISWRNRWLKKLLSQSPGTPARKRFAELLEQKFGTIEKLKSDFDRVDIHVASFDEIGLDLVWPAFKKRVPQAVDLMKSYNALIAETFYRVTTEAIKKHDPNHLVLGTRFVGDAEIEVLKSVKGFTDVISFNKYPQGGKVPLSLYEKMYEYSGKPLLHTEFSFLEAGRNGPYPSAPNQEMRGIYYKELVTSIVEVKELVGFGWHEIYDPKAEGNFGLYDIHDKLYTDAAKHVIEANRMVEERFAEIIKAKAGEPR